MFEFICPCQCLPTENNFLNSDQRNSMTFSSFFFSPSIRLLKTNWMEKQIANETLYKWLKKNINLVFLFSCSHLQEKYKFIIKTSLTFTIIVKILITSMGTHPFKITWYFHNSCTINLHKMQCMTSIIKPSVTNDGLEASQHQASGLTFDH